MMNINGLWASLSTLGPAAMFLVTVADTAVLPTAQAVDLLILVQAATAPEHSWELGLCAVAGSTLGAMLLYFLARKGGSPLLVKIFSEGRIERVKEKLLRYDALALAIPSALPLPLFPMKLFVASAGVLEVAPGRTAMIVAAGRSVRYFGLILLGRWLGVDAWPVIQDNAWVALAVCLVPVAILIWLNHGRSAGVRTNQAA